MAATAQQLRIRLSGMACLAQRSCSPHERAGCRPVLRSCLAGRPAEQGCDCSRCLGHPGSGISHHRACEGGEGAGSQRTPAPYPRCFRLRRASDAPAAPCRLPWPHPLAVQRYGYIGWEHLASGMRAALTCARAAPIDAAAPASPAAASNPSLPSSPAQQGSRASPRGTAGDPETPRGAIVPALGSEAGTEPGSLLPPGPLSHTGPQGSADVGASSAVAQPGSSGGSLRHRAAARDGSAAGASSAGSSTATPAGSSEPEGSHTAAGEWPRRGPLCCIMAHRCLGRLGGTAA